MQFIRDERTPKDIRGRLPCMQFIETLHSCVRRKTCCQLLWGNSENTENYEYCITFQRTFVHDCRSWVIILYRTVSFKISSYSRPYVRIMHESTKAQISLRPSLGKETFNLKNGLFATTSKRAKSVRRDSSLLLSLSSFFFRDFIIIIIVIIFLLLFSFGLTVKSEMVNAFG